MSKVTDAAIAPREQRDREPDDIGVSVAPARTRRPVALPDARALVALVPLALVVASVVFQLVVLRSELHVVTPRNDDAASVALVDTSATRATDPRALLDGWFARTAGGLPQRDVPSLATIAAAEIADHANAATVVAWAHYLLWCTVPLAFYWALRLFGFHPWIAGITGLVAPLLSSAAPRAMTSAAWSFVGPGGWTTIAAIWLLPISFALSWRAVTRDRSAALAALALAIVACTNLEVGFVALLALVASVAGAPRADREQSAKRAVVVAVTGFVASAWVLVPLIVDGVSPARAYVRVVALPARSRATQLHDLFTGALFDHRRLPVISALVVIGAVVALARMARDLRMRAVVVFAALALAALVVLDGTSGIVAVDMTAVLLAGIGAAWVAQETYVAVRRHAPPRVVRPSTVVAALVLVGLVLLLPATYQVAQLGSDDARAIRIQQRADRSDGHDLEVLASTAAVAGGGRAALMPGAVVGTAPAATYLLERVDAIGGTASTPARAVDRGMTSDALGVRYLITTSDQPPAVPAILVQSAGHWQLWQVPASGYLALESGNGQVTPSIEDPNRARFVADVSTPASTALIIKMNDARGWTARVDGRSAHVTNTHGFVAVPLVAGSHHVDVTYAPSSYPVVLLVVGVAVVLLLALATPFVRRRSQRTPPAG